MKIAVALVIVGACGSKDGTAPGPASATKIVIDAAVATASMPDSGKGRGTGTGALIVHVTWPNAPAKAREVGPRNACGVARRPRATISTLHGVASAIVVVTDLPAPAAKTQAAPVDLVVRACRIEPRVAIAAGGATVRLASADLRRHRVEVAAGVAPSAVASWKEPASRGAIDLAWAGDEVAVAPGPPAILRLAPDMAADDPSWIVVPDSLTAVTDEGGAVTLAALPAGTHHVIAWLPDATAPELAQADVDVVAGTDNEVTLSFP